MPSPRLGSGVAAGGNHKVVCGERNICAGRLYHRYGPDAADRGKRIETFWIALQFGGPQRSSRGVGHQP